MIRACASCVLLTGLGLGAVASVEAQDVPSGTILTFGIEPGVRISDNIGLDPDPEGTTFLTETDLSFGYSSETPLQSLSLDLEAVARAAAGQEISDDASGLGDPRLNFSYTRGSADSRFSASAFFHKVDLDFDDPFDEDTGIGGARVPEGAEGLVDEQRDLQNEALANDTGTRTTYATDLSFETGLSDPLGLRVSLGFSKVDYSGTIDPDLFDSRTQSYSATAFARPSAITETRLTATRRDFTSEEFGGRDRTSNSVSVGVVRNFSPLLTLDAQLGVQEVEESFDLFPSLDSTERGAIATLMLSRTLPTGEISATLDRSIDEDGARTRVEVRRALDLPRGDLTVSVGATRGEKTDPQAIADINYTRPVPRGEVSVSLSRSVNIDNDDAQTSLVTRAALSYRVDVNSISSISMDLDYATSEDQNQSALDNTSDEGSEGRLRAAYNRDLTADWGLSAGYQYRFDDDADQEKAEANEIFLSLNRQFAIRP